MIESCKALPYRHVTFCNISDDIPNLHRPLSALCVHEIEKEFQAHLLGQQHTAGETLQAAIASCVFSQVAKLEAIIPEFCAS